MYQIVKVNKDTAYADIGIGQSTGELLGGIGFFLDDETYLNTDITDMKEAIQIYKKIKNGE